LGGPLSKDGGPFLYLPIENPPENGKFCGKNGGQKFTSKPKIHPKNSPLGPKKGERGCRGGQIFFGVNLIF
jgi:hypothetical protein